MRPLKNGIALQHHSTWANHDQLCIDSICELSMRLAMSDSNNTGHLGARGLVGDHLVISNVAAVQTWIQLLYKYMLTKYTFNVFHVRLAQFDRTVLCNTCCTSTCFFCFFYCIFFFVQCFFQYVFLKEEVAVDPTCALQVASRYLWPDS